MYSTGCTLQCVIQSYIRKFSICACMCGKKYIKNHRLETFCTEPCHKEKNSF